MTVSDEQLSAFMDGELPPEEAARVREALQADGSLRERLDRLLSAEGAATAGFRAALAEPMPLDLVRSIKEAPDPGPAEAPPAAPPQRSRVRFALAASVALLAFTGLGAGAGYFAATAPWRGGAPQPPPGWLAQVADYHRIYATQVRHLVEVPAEDKDHLEAWLGETVGLRFRVPDLSDEGLVFRGGRLLVAAGKPVAQLLYTAETGSVVGLCFIATGKEDAPFSRREIGGLEMVVWRRGGFAFVALSDRPEPRLESIAETAAQRL